MSTFALQACFLSDPAWKSRRTASYKFCTPLKWRQTLAAEAFITKVQNELQKVGYKKKSIQQQAAGYKQHESCLFTVLRKIHFDNDLVKLLCNTIVLLVRALAQHLSNSSWPQSETPLSAMDFRTYFHELGSSSFKTARYKIIKRIICSKYRI